MGMNLSRLDVNLLVALDALLQQRSVTKAAAQMGLTQPALSASLGRLRRHFSDDLLYRVGNEYQLTPLALQLREPTMVAIASVNRVFAAQPEFDPALSDREFNLLVSDYAVLLLGEAVARLVSQEAPQGRLRLTPHSPSMIERVEQVLLTADVLLMPHGFITDLPHVDLFRDEWMCVVSADNPVTDAELTIKYLKSAPWVITYHGHSATTPAASHMRMLGIETSAQVITESFTAVPPLIAGSDRIALLQRRLVEALPPTVGIRAVTPPFASAPLIEAMWWHPARTKDPEHQYLRDLIVRAARQAVR